MKKLMMLAIGLAMVVGLVTSIPAAVAGSKDELEASKDPASCNGLVFGTGQKGKGFSKLFSNIDQVCGNVVEMCELRTSGAVDNLTSMSTNAADIGLTDIVSFLNMQGDENIRDLQAVLSLNHNFLHVLANSEGYTVTTKKWGVMKDTTQEYVKSFTDLRGKTIALVGSAGLIGRKLNDMMGMGMTFVDAKDDAEAQAMLKKFQVQGVFTMSGWPSGVVDKLTANDKITLVPFNATVAAPFVVKPINYRNLGVYNAPAVAVPNVILTRPFKAGGEKAMMVSKLSNCLKSKISALQEGRFEAAWKEVKDVENVQGLTKFAASREVKTAAKK